MPILECDSWREQYFAGIECPAHVVVPTDDPECWRLFPRHRWVYNKLLICDTQGVECGPHGVEPTHFPVFSKPIYNMRGMGTGSRVVHSAAELHAALSPGHMWMRLLEGEHVSTDVAIEAGQVHWWRHAHGESLGTGIFDYWTVLADARPALERSLARWISRHLPDYTGMANFETIGGAIIECHLRFSDQWPDLYGGADWVRAVVRLYEGNGWRYDDTSRRTGYSVVLWDAHGARHRPPAARTVERVLAREGVSSVQITFDPDRPADEHAMPPGGFRLAIVNAWTLEAGRAGRDALSADMFGSKLAL
jgi:hypothetical protein